MSKSQDSRDFPLFNAARSQRSSTAKKKSPNEPGDVSQNDPVLAEMRGISSRLELIDSRLDSIDTRLNTIAKNRISTLDDSADIQQTAIAKLRGELAQLLTTVDDLENRSRRKNLRIIGLPEKAEGSDLTKFLREMFPTWLELPAELSMEIKRAHRSPTALSNSKTTPRNITVRFLRYSDKETILRATQVKQHVSENNNSTIRIFQDFSAEVMRSRREFEAAEKCTRGQAHVPGLHLTRKAAVSL
ncbi:hypothetical protein MHYP_G00226130 [Metynnis hypsauchen]